MQNDNRLPAPFHGTLTMKSDGSNLRGPITGRYGLIPEIGECFAICSDKPINSEADFRYVRTSKVKKILAQNIETIVFETESGNVYKLEHCQAP